MKASIKVLAAAALVLGFSSAAARAETVYTKDFACLHHETMEEFDRLTGLGRTGALEIMRLSTKTVDSGECVTFDFGTKVRIVKRLGNNVCIFSAIGWSDTIECWWFLAKYVQ